MENISRRFLKCICLLVLTATTIRAQQNSQYKYLVLKGGGVRGIAYTGAVRALEEHHVTQGLEKIGGTSIGALVAAMMCVGLNATEMEQLMLDLNVSSFNDGEWYFVGGSRRVRRNYGWYKGNKLEQWLADILEKQTGSDTITFAQLHNMALKDKRFKDLYVTATNLSKQRSEIFSWEATPDMQIKTAVRASVSIPLYYAAVLLDSTGHLYNKSKGGHYDVYADGGLKANYPITMFNTLEDDERRRVNPCTLGLKLERPEQISYEATNHGIAPFEIHSLGSYLGALYNLTIEQLNPPVPYEEERKHTIYISTSNINPRVRKVSMAQKKLLFENGEKAAAAFFGR